LLFTFPEEQDEAYRKGPAGVAFILPDKSRRIKRSGGTAKEKKTEEQRQERISYFGHVVPSLTFSSAIQTWARKRKKWRRIARK
jgi:endonuclease I